MRGVFAAHFYSIASGDLLYQVRDLMHSPAKSSDFAEQRRRYVQVNQQNQLNPGSDNVAQRTER